MIYLAGGMKSGWQDKVIAAAPANAYFDPRKHGLVTPSLYTQWDTDAIQRSDLVIAVMEKDNPSGFGLSFEVGYVYSLSIPVWFVMSAADERYKYFGMVGAASDHIFGSMAELLEELKRMPVA